MHASPALRSRNTSSDESGVRTMGRGRWRRGGEGGRSREQSTRARDRAATLVLAARSGPASAPGRAGPLGRAPALLAGQAQPQACRGLP